MKLASLVKSERGMDEGMLEQGKTRSEFGVLEGRL